jgi:O-antigen/teichoic acid export membrane protein
MSNKPIDRTSLNRKATRNSLYSMAVNLWYLLSRFLLTPLILNYISLSEYGLWSLCFVVMSFLALSSMGLETTYIKYVAQFHAENRLTAINQLLSTGLLITSCFALVTMIVLWQGLPLLLSLLKIPAELTDKAYFVFMGTGLIFMLDISLNCFARALDGYQYLALTARIRFWSSLVELMLIVPLLMTGFGIYGLMTAFFLRYLLVILVNIIYAYKLIPDLHLSPHLVNRSSLKILLSYGSRMQLLSTINILIATFDRLIITSFLGLAANGLYEIGRKIPNKGARIPTEISGAIMPALSHLQGSRDMIGARVLFLNGSRYMAMLSAPLFCFFAAVAPQAIFIWLGTGYEGAATIMQIISLATIIHLLTGASSALARGLDRLDWELKYACFNLILCVIFTPLLAWLFGLVGSAAAVSIAITCSSCYFISMTHKFFNISLTEYKHAVLTPLLLSLISGIALHFCLPVVTAGTQGRGVMLLILILAGIGYFTLFSTLLLFCGNLTELEKTWLQDRFKKIGFLRHFTPLTNRR